MSYVRILSLPAWCVGCLLAALVAGCATAPRPPQEVAQGSAAAVVAGVTEPGTSAAPMPSAEPVIAQPEPAADTAAAVPPVASDAAPASIASESSTAKPDRAVPTPTPKPAAPSPATPPSAPKVAAAAPAKPPSPPPLDLKSLETRLRETKAIGVYTKLTLKNQVDDLLDAFRAYYKGQAKSTLAELRRAFDQLVLKVLALLQDADPPLASAIAASREAIWGILSDPAKFATV